ncbi:putative periplasmic lipoprotein [Mucilaginibacter lappiensis]|uniref:PBP1b-binding outer membrane lipoprotein LpoB n=1 Tax=Mucilaginibacter lappiensis TaxID=354630 RepID=A0A841JEQ9_9SPHI|nr:hypothetical protein [Mucilaginibacter lappiensis]MBB6127118.1 PBP1b-binding outer membrane lipoprotein LpoB [Mucilaginibacter lappiensis]
MKRYFYLLAIVLLMASCKSNKAGKIVKADTDSVKTQQTVQVVQQQKTDPVQDQHSSLAKNMLGSWSADTTDGVTLIIDKKKFTYPDNDTSYSYKFIGDSVNINYGDFKESFKMELKGKDSLLMGNVTNGTSVFFRVK